MLTFPTRTRGGRFAPGRPHRAQACQCGPKALIHDGECHRCGHYTDRTIRHTWHTRAQDIAQDNARRKAAA